MHRVANGIIRPLTTPAFFLEYKDVLQRPEHLRAFGISIAEIDQYLDGFAAVVHPVEVHYRWRPQLPDPNDELVFEAAINGGATAVITHNIRDFTLAGVSFGIEALPPAEALRRLRG